MKVCYAITSGEYSSYGIKAVFSTRELAKASLRHYDDARIEEFSLDPVTPTGPNGLVGYACYLWECGTIQVKAESVEYIGRQEIGKVMNLNNSRFCPTVYVWAKDHDHAIKIASEKFAQQRAIDAGVG